MKTAATTSLFLLLRAATTLARCDNGPCDDPAVLGLETSECQKHHIFTARGSTAPKPGHAGEMLRQICEGLDDCGYEEIDYPAKGGAQGPGAWCKSAHEGALNGQKQMTDYAEKCPDSKLILVGFSQGASVALDILGGGGGVKVFGCNQEENGPLLRSESPGNRIVAAAVFGPTVRSAGHNYTVKGAEEFDGTAKRTEVSDAHLEPYNAAGVLREWCNFGDPICAKGSKPSSVDNHLNYFYKYTEEGAEWVINTVENPSPNFDNVLEANTTFSSTTSSTPSPSVTASKSESNKPEATGTPPKAATSPTTDPENKNSEPTPQNAEGTSSALPTISVARNTWFLCGAVVAGTLFFFVLIFFSGTVRRFRLLSRGFVPLNSSPSTV